MHNLGNESYSGTVTDQTLVAAPSAADGPRKIKRLRLSVKSATCRVILKIGSETHIDQDFPDGGGLSECYDSDPLIQNVGEAVTVSTVGTGTTTRVSALGN